MTKAEIKTALEAKFDKVGEFEGNYPEVLGMARYDIKVFSVGKGVSTYSVFVEDDGGAGENAIFGGSNPLEEEPAVEPDFRQKVLAEIESYKDAGTILDAYIDLTAMGASVAEVVAFRDVSGDVVKERYVIHENADGSFVFKKLS